MKSKLYPRLGQVVRLLCAISVLDTAGTMTAPSLAQAAEVASIADATGSLHVPTDYREKYEFLGSWAIAADKGQGSQQIHVVYASPGAIEAFRQHGAFPDGTVLVKEVHSTTTAPMTTGAVSREQDLKGWFVMVKDAKGSHPGNKLWGDGWGWSWFDAGKPTKTTSTDYKSDCLGCHIPAKSTDWIYTQGYPPLLK
jgi:Cytochrome P460